MLICVVKDACTKCYQLPCAKLVTFVDPVKVAWPCVELRLFTQPAMPQPTLVAVLLETMEKKAPENAALRGEPFISSANSRRCKASRPRMKQTDVNLLCSGFGFVIKVYNSLSC
ncbi:hypothetical protein NC651_006189 [Populus alba x Populus x berolinensis]|nr:hypothetical protein NC651_006189 [Populus alba x Populus x berolinensis]